MIPKQFRLLLCSVTILVKLKCASCSEPSVVIVGAGAAGLATARLLLDTGITNFTILEAQDRVGGRVHSVKFGDSMVDIGAEFCHGTYGNVVWLLVNDLNVLTPSPKNFKQTFFYSNGSWLGDPLAGDLARFMGQFESEAFADLFGVNSNGHDPGESLGHRVKEVFNNTIAKKYANDPESSRLLQDIVAALEHFLISPEGSYTWSEVSAKQHYRQCGGDQMQTWSGYGYKKALDVMAGVCQTQIDQRTLLNTKVSKITWDSPGGVKVQCADGTTIAADHVVFTPSVGVLKMNHATLFSPPLPLSKRKAIEDIGFEGILKIIMHFPKKWWNDDDFDSLNFVWSDQDLRSNNFTEGPSKDGKSWITDISFLLKDANNSKVLTAVVTGTQVPDIERLPQTTILDGVTYVLRKFLGTSFAVTPPDQVLYSKWISNPNIRGTYSFETAESHRKNQKNQEELTKPLVNDANVPVVLFAGEATHPLHYSTVHGAIETGIREADRIGRIYQKTQIKIL